MNEANTSYFNCLAYRPTNRLTQINAYNFCALFNLENCLQDQLPEVAVCNRWLCGCGSLRTGTDQFPHLIQWRGHHNSRSFVGSGILIIFLCQWSSSLRHKSKRRQFQTWDFIYERNQGRNCARLGGGLPSTSSGGRDGDPSPTTAFRAGTPSSQVKKQAPYLQWEICEQIKFAESRTVLQRPELLEKNPGQVEFNSRNGFTPCSAKTSRTV